jgi:hypothetical protein
MLSSHSDIISVLGSSIIVSFSKIPDSLKLPSGSANSDIVENSGSELKNSYSRSKCLWPSGDISSKMIDSKRLLYSMLCSYAISFASIGVPSIFMACKSKSTASTTLFKFSNFVLLL